MTEHFRTLWVDLVCVQMIFICPHDIVIKPVPSTISSRCPDTQTLLMQVQRLLLILVHKLTVSIAKLLRIRVDPERFILDDLGVRVYAWAPYGLFAQNIVTCQLLHAWGLLSISGGRGVDIEVLRMSVIRRRRGPVRWSVVGHVRESLKDVVQLALRLLLLASHLLNAHH